MHAGVQLSLGTHRVHQRQGKTFPVRPDPGGMLALVPAGVGLALDDYRKDAVLPAQLFEVGDLFGNVFALGGAWGTERDQALAALHCGADGVGQISVGGQVFLVAEDGVDPLGDGLAEFVGFICKLCGHLIGFEGEVQPAGPLAAFLLVVHMTVGDEGLILGLQVLGGEGGLAGGVRAHGLFLTLVAIGLLYTLG